MHTAWDKQRNKVITPSEAQRGTYYYCLGCKKAVTVRALGPYSLVTPYFAHLKYVSGEDCPYFVSGEYTYNPSYFGQEISLPVNPTPPLQKNTANANFSRNLYLIYEKNWELKLILTLMPSLNRWDGYIDITAAYGTKRIVNVMNERRLEIDVNFNFSLDSIKREGRVDDETWGNLINNFDLINPIGGIFNAPFGTGRKLAPGEKLRLGETYVFIPSKEFEFNNTISSISENVFNKDNINLYQFTLSDNLATDKIDDIEKAFDREIAKNKPEIKALNLFPLKITTDGTYIVSPDTTELRFETEIKSEIDVRMIQGLGANHVEYDNDLIIVDISQSSGLEIYWNHYPMIRICKGNADFYNTKGITLEIDQQEFNILDKNLKENIAKNKTIKLHSAYLQVANLVKFRFLNSIENINVEDIIEITDDFELDAQGFGYIYYCHNEEITKEITGNNNSLPHNWLIFSGQLSKNHKEIKNVLRSLDQINDKYSGQAKFHLMKLKNINKLR